MNLDSYFYFKGRLIGTNFLSEITLGNFKDSVEARTFKSYSATMFTLSKKTALIASCQPHKDKGK